MARFLDVINQNGDIGDIKSSYISNSTWLKCDGSTYLKSAYPELANYLGSLNLKEWKPINLFSGVGTSIDGFRGIVYANGKFTVICTGKIWDGTTTSSTANIYNSTDGINWTTATLPDYGDWNCLTYGNGLYIAFDYGTTRYITSTDGINWTLRNISFHEINSTGIAYGNGMFIVVGWYTDSNAQQIGCAYRSTSGTNWIECTSGLYNSGSTGKSGNRKWDDIAFGNGLFMVIGNFGPKIEMTTKSSYRAWSADGINWTGEFVIPTVTDPIFYLNPYDTIDKYSAYQLNPDYFPLVTSVTFNPINNGFVCTVANEKCVIVSVPDPTDSKGWSFKFKMLPFAANWSNSSVNDQGHIMLIAQGSDKSLISTDVNIYNEWNEEQLPKGFGRWRNIIYANNMFLTLSNSNYSPNGAIYVNRYNPTTEFAVPNLNSDENNFVIKGK